MAAQGYQESTLDQSKRSHVGAIGVMQVMPTTAKDKAVNIPDIENLESNIHAGIKYNRWVVDNFYNDEAIAPIDRQLFAFASYNAGPGPRRAAEKGSRRAGAQSEQVVQQRRAHRREAHRARDGPVRRQHLQVLPGLSDGDAAARAAERGEGHERVKAPLMRLLALLLLGVAASQPPRIMTSADLASFESPEPDERIPYGDDPLQFGELRLPDGPGPHPVAILIHGGCWLSEYDITHLRKLAAAITETGVATWALEYRRVGNPGGGWPGTFQDIARGADHLRESGEDSSSGPRPRRRGGTLGGRPSRALARGAIEALGPRAVPGGEPGGARSRPRSRSRARPRLPSRAERVRRRHRQASRRVSRKPTRALSVGFPGEPGASGGSPDPAPREATTRTGHRWAAGTSTPRRPRETTCASWRRPNRATSR